MHNLIYLSSASYLYSNHDLLDILNTSRLNNTKLDVTGLLLYSEGSILQILEGEKEVLNTLFKKISGDKRHKGVIKMMDVSVKERSFQEWSMGFKQISTEDWNKLSGYLNPYNKDEFKQITASGSAEIIKIIKSFTTVNMRSV
jgi:Sensors of blue-light using FAD